MRQEIFRPSLSIIPQSFEYKIYLLLELIIFSYLGSTIFFSIVYTGSINFSFSPFYFLIFFVIMIFLLLVFRFLNFHFKYIEIDGQNIKIVDNIWFPRIKKEFNLNDISELEFRKSWRWIAFGEPWIYQMFFILNGKKEKVPLPGWDIKTLGKVLKLISKNAQKLKIITSNKVSWLTRTY